MTAANDYGLEIKFTREVWNDPVTLTFVLVTAVGVKDIARRCRVTPRTVSAWLKGRKPLRRHFARLVQLRRCLARGKYIVEP